MTDQTDVVGVDACKNGWIAVVLSGLAFERAVHAPDMTSLLKSIEGVSAIAVDIPIGIDGPYPRRADVSAREFVGNRRSSVFSTPPRAVLATSDHEQATRLGSETLGTGVSRQAYALGPKILEVDEVARTDSRIIEVHPEVCFRALAGHALSHSKKSWNGMKQREQLLREAGIEIASDLPVPGSVQLTMFSTPLLRHGRPTDTPME